MTSRPSYPGEDPPRRRLPGPGPYPPDYHLPAPYGSDFLASYPRPPKKKPKWPWLLGAIVVVSLVIGGACIAFTGDGNQEQQIREPVTLTYEVRSDGPLAADITYSSGDGGTIEHADQQRLPWSTQVTVTGLDHSFSLTAQADRTATTITCTVGEAGKILTAHTSTGPSAIVSCRGHAG
ncbi:MmpS family transport accessory protein [Nocardia sp. NPDC050193]